MRRGFGVAAAFVAALGVQLLAQEGPAALRKATEDDYKKLAAQTSFSGKVGGVGPKSISVYIDDKAYQDQLRMINAMKDSPLKVQKLKQLEAQYKVSALGKEYEFEFTAKPVLRRLNLPAVEFDEKGFPKKMTGAELAKLKGDSSKPGYVAQPEHFTVGSYVKVTLVRGKGTRPLASMAVVDNKVSP